MTTRMHYAQYPITSLFRPLLRSLYDLPSQRASNMCTSLPLALLPASASPQERQKSRWVCSRARGRESALLREPTAPPGRLIISLIRDWNSAQRAVDFPTNKTNKRAEWVGGFPGV